MATDRDALRAVQALAAEIVEALLADEQDGGYDLTAGMFGAAFSTLVRRWCAAELAQQGTHLLPTVFEAEATAVLNMIKAWRDCDGNGGFPHEARERMDAFLMAIGLRRAPAAPQPATQALSAPDSERAARAKAMTAAQVAKLLRQEAVCVSRMNVWQLDRAAELLEAQPASQQAAAEPVQCLTCNGHGMIGVHASDGSWDGQDCPACSASAAPPVEQQAAALMAPTALRKTISDLLTDAMNVAVRNGADSRSMPDEYVALAAWLCEQPAPQGGCACGDGGDGLRCPRADGTLLCEPEQPALQAGAAELQARVQPWLMACFGPEIASDRNERNHRFLEEALELVQACGCTASEAHQLVDYTFSRPVGEASQEVGGVMITLAALCLANGLDMHAAGETELTRIWTMVEKIRAKQAAKPKHSPLPGLATEPPSQDAQDLDWLESNGRETSWGEDYVRWIVTGTPGRSLRQNIAAARAAQAQGGVRA